MNDRPNNDNIENILGTGYICIPDNLNKSSFIKDCFRKEQFSIITNDGVLINSCFCSKQVLNYIEFPKDKNSLGIQVVYMRLVEQNSVIIIGTLPKFGIPQFQEQNNLIINKIAENGNSIGINGNAFLSKIKFYCRNLYNKVSELTLECIGNKDSKLKLFSSGWICIQGEKSIKIINKNKQIIIDDDKIFICNSQKQNLIIKDNQFIYKDGVNKFTIDKDGYKLGNINFKDYIKEILDYLNTKITLLTPMGPTTPGAQSGPSASILKMLIQKIEKINETE